VSVTRNYGGVERSNQNEFVKEKKEKFLNIILHFTKPLDALRYR